MHKNPNNVEEIEYFIFNPFPNLFALGNHYQFGVNFANPFPIHLYSFGFFFLAALGLLRCVWAFSSCSKRGLLFIAVCGFLIVVASLVVEHGL